MKKSFHSWLNGVLTISILLSSGSAFARSWNDVSYTKGVSGKTYMNDNSPNWFNTPWHPVNYNYQFTALPTNGKVDSNHIPWGDSYWPKNHGAFNYRWKKFQDENMEQEMTPQELDRLFFHNVTPSPDQLASMSQADIDTLSPTEKYSIFTGDFHYRLVSKWYSRWKENTPDRAYWEGYCHAWAAAALNYAEPQPVSFPITLPNKQTITLNFGSGDIKALIVASFADGFNSIKRAQIGNKCQLSFMYPKTKFRHGKEVMADYADYEGVMEGELQSRVTQYELDLQRLGLPPEGVDPAKAQNYAENDGACEDTNAGAFHVMAANQLGMMHEGFALDKTRDAEVWNQPAYAFDTKVVGTVPNGPRSAPGTSRTIQVETKLYYADDTDYGWAFWYPTLTNLFSVETNFMAEFDRYQKLLINEGDQTTAAKYPANVIDSDTYQYTLELDAQDKILGGEWLTLERPDYLWIAEKTGFGSGYEGLNRLYKPIVVPAGFDPKLDN